MVKRKQVLTMVSIAVISFLLGTMFNMNFIAIGGSSSPWDRVWTAIAELQNEVNSINEKLNQTKEIRFVDPTEHIQSEHVWKDIANFTWLPSNETNNAILSAAFYFEYKHKPPAPGYPTDAFLKVYIEDIEVYDVLHYIWNEDYKWSTVYVLPSPLNTHAELASPNQASYTITVRLDVSQGTAFLRNINIILTVADGLPASN